jgi:hypothetical protein
VPGLFAAFWILLAVFSGTYLFRIITEPQAERTDAATPRTASASATSAEGGPAAPPPPGASVMSAGQAEALIRSNDAKDKEIGELKSVVRDLSGQVTGLSDRLRPLEKVLGPVAALPSSTAVTTSPPSPEPMQPVEKPALPPAAAATVEESSAEDQKPVNAAKPTERPAAEAKAFRKDASTTPSADASGTRSGPVTSEEPGSSEPSPSNETANLNPAPSIPPATTRFGIEIGSVGKQDEIRPMWKNLLTNHAALVAGLQARRVMAPDKKWRLIAGPFSSAAEATQACGLFKKANMPCEATVFAGDSF